MLSYLFIVKNELPSAIKFLMGKEEEFLDWYVLDGRVLVVLVTCCIILPLCLLKNLGYLGYTSGFSLSCMVFFLIVVIYKKFQISCMSIEQNSTISANVTDMCTPKYVTFNSKTVYALPTIAFAFVCHPSVLPIYSELKDRSQKKMQMVSNISFFAMFVMYFLTAIFGYLTFYEKVQPDLLHKYQGQNDILILTVQLAVIVAVILTVPVLFFTVRSSLFELTKKTKFHLCRHVLVTIILLLIIDLLVIFIPSMKDIFGVVDFTQSSFPLFAIMFCGFFSVENMIIRDASNGYAKNSAVELRPPKLVSLKLWPPGQPHGPHLQIQNTNPHRHQTVDKANCSLQVSGLDSQ
ncbi:sodium-coupled neutral amino acid transporter 1-like protein [Cricetulus griseus]|uniref:Sodium-coupled neutral amino acid transporter 1-like protein n=1 Tax=Cricetulus griseus TaxID=10029 RepID=A0A061IKV7_CRIGR|nr:sodium-coupled neutral amino acid transporter 1-like protein [Cricetulus griseus]